MTDRASWALSPGDEVVPGRTAIAGLGGGARFEVYLASDDLLMQTVVVKLLRPDRVQNPRALRALQNEIEALRRLAHPVIVRAFAADTAAPRPFIVLEHADGPTLRRLVKANGPLPVEQVLPAAVGVASALHYMARMEMVHLDVKPANIVMGASPTLIDLSLARTVERADKIEDPIGTGAFMAPEQCAPGIYGRPGPASDVWGLGVTLYLACEGRRPFPAGDKAAKTAGERYPQLNAQPAAMTRVRGPLAEAVMDCLRKDPAARPSATELIEGLEPVVGEIPARPRVRRR